MKKARYIFLSLVCCMMSVAAEAQVYNQIDEEGNITQRDEQGNGNFNKHRTDTTKQKKEIPRGLYVWAIDRRFGDVRPALPDTMPHLFMNSIFNTGKEGEFNTTGNNYTARLNRIVIDRPEFDQFLFTQPYSWVMKQPDEFHFTNTLSPFTNITYDNCGNNQNGEDHIDAKFAVNVNKQLGFGFDLNYAYARGYYSGQSTSHFGATFFASYRGDQYQLHALFSNYHQKATENGGITNDTYIKHPESIETTFSENEIPTVLSSNWNRNDNTHFLLSHRYNIGFYRKVKMTDEEIKARQFAAASKKENAPNIKEQGARGREQDGPAPAGRPKGAAIAGSLEPANPRPSTLNPPSDSTRITVDSHAVRDSLLAVEARNDSLEALMKHEFVPVTSFIHTLDINKYTRIYQAYKSPDNYYADTYYNRNDDRAYSGDSIYDQTKMLSIKNTFAIALLEGFNKYAKAGLKVFASHELRKFQMPDTIAGENYTQIERWNEHSVSIGGQIVKTQGHTLHYNLLAETWLTGKDAGQMKIDFNADLNFPLFGDTVQLAAHAYFHRLTPVFYQRRYHSKHLWWDNDDLSKETRTRLEGLFTYRKTNTQLRFAIEEIQNYTYFGMSYNANDKGRTNMTAGVYQASGNINLLTAQLRQSLSFSIINWENVITYQNSSNQDVLPVPALNIFSNLYLKFKIVRQLTVELGADVTYFTKYYAPDFCPQLNQFAIQRNTDSHVEIGNYPFIDVYANMHLKRTRFFIMYSHINAGSGSRNYFLTPHYPMNDSILRFGVSWNFYN